MQMQADALQEYHQERRIQMCVEMLRNWMEKGINQKPRGGKKGEHFPELKRNIISKKVIRQQPEQIESRETVVS